MAHRELTIKGFHGTCDEDRLFEYLANEEHLTLVASEDAPCLLEDGIREMSTARRVPPSTVWHELISAGYEDLLLRKWKGNPETNVATALRRIYNPECRGMYPILYHMIRAYNSHSDGIRSGRQVFAVLRAGLYVDTEDEDESCVDDVLAEWGLDFGDTCCLFAAYAAGKRGASIPYSDHLERCEEYLRRKVWSINALVSQSVNPIGKSVFEEAQEILSRAGGMRK